MKFHRDNPRVYVALVGYSRAAKAAGLKHGGIRMAWERTRWFFNVEIKQADQTFKLSDHYHMHYARLIMQQEPDLAGFFRTKKSADERAGWAA